MLASAQLVDSTSAVGEEVVSALDAWRHKPVAVVFQATRPRPGRQAARAPVRIAPAERATAGRVAWKTTATGLWRQASIALTTSSPAGLVESTTWAEASMSLARSSWERGENSDALACRIVTGGTSASRVRPRGCWTRSLPVPLSK